MGRNYFRFVSWSRPLLLEIVLDLLSAFATALLHGFGAEMSAASRRFRPIFHNLTTGWTDQALLPP
jgi:hypothetical protein